MWDAAIVIASAASIFAGVWPGPAASPAPEPLPAEVILDRYTAVAAERWEAMSLGTEIPEVTIVSETTEQNWDTTYAQCYRDAGFTVIGDAGSGWTMDPPSDVTSKEADASAFDCDTSFPWQQNLDAFKSDAELDALYDYYIHQVSLCLRLIGAPPSARTPDREAFVDPETHFPVWSPYWFVSAPVDSADWDRYQETCPDRPPWERETATEVELGFF